MMIIDATVIALTASTLRLNRTDRSAGQVNSR